MSRNDLILLPKRVLFIQPKTPKMEALKHYLEEKNYEIIHWNRPNPYKFKEKLLWVQADIVLVDIAMFKETMCRYAMVKAIEYSQSFTQIIFLTHEIESSILEAAKKCRVASYLLKPCSEYEIFIALELTLNRKYQKEEKEYLKESLLAYNYKFCFSSKRLFHNEKEVLLSKNGKLLLELLIKNRGCIVSFEQIVYHIWNHDHSLASLRSLVHRIHTQIHEPLIENIKGVGYRVKMAY